MALLDAQSSSPVRRAIAPRRPQRAVFRLGAIQPTGATQSSVSESSLDPTDRRILSLERAAPGPHYEAAGISRESYLARLRRLVYDREANEYAPEVLARLRVELCFDGASPTRY